MALLELRQIVTCYGPVEALRGVDLRVEKGEIVALVGGNGAGKSTLLMSIFGQPRPASGQVLYEDRDISTRATHELVRLGIAYVPEGRRIFPRMTVLENLQLGAHAGEALNLAKDIERMFEMFPILRTRVGQRAGTLSGGEQQMLAIARGLMSRPQLLLLDEPSLGLAPLIARQIFSIITTLNREQGITVVLVEQDANHALRIAHRGYVLVNGQVTLTGTGAELLANPAIRAAYLEGAGS